MSSMQSGGASSKSAKMWRVGLRMLEKMMQRLSTERQRGQGDASIGADKVEVDETTGL
jgi:hypothetical protein